MKILSVEFENLNSLVGRTKIDFTDPKFAENGIFAIVGPTGSGKTTILDAICLALYGKTPRLSNISQSENEIMSRGTGFCLSEIGFETKRGRFRCVWHQHRAGRIANGRLQPQTHEISDATTGNILENKVSRVPGVVEEKTGMDFDRFTRSMLLAQGNFAKFLQSSEKDRADILEQITGTTIYGEISKNVFERNKAEETKLAIFGNQLEDVRPLAPEALAVIEKDLADLESNESKAKRSLDHVQTGLRHFHRRNELTEEAERLQQDRLTLSADESSFAENARRLDAARKAKKVESVFEKRNDLKRQCETARNRSLQASQRTAGADANLRQARSRETDASETLKKTEEIQSSKQALLLEVQALDTKIGIHSQMILELEHQQAIEKAKKLSKEKDVAADRKRFEKLFFDETFETIRLKQEELERQTETLLGGREMSEILDERKHGADAKEDWKRLAAGVELLRKNDAASLELAAKDREIDLRIIEWQRRIETAEGEIRHAEEVVSLLDGQARLRDKIRNLEDQRRDLHEGEPCPLCGSLDHPFVFDLPPESDDTILQLEEAREKFRQLERNLGDDRIEYAKQLQQKEQHQREREKIAGLSAEETRSLSPLLAKLGLDRFPDEKIVVENIDRIDADIKASEKLVLEIEQSRKQAETFRRQVAQAVEIESTIRKDAALIAAFQQEIESKEIRLAELRTQKQELVEQRSVLFGEDNPDDVRRHLADDVDKVRTQLENARKNTVEIEKSLIEAQEQYKAAESSIERYEAEIQEIEVLFRGRCDENGFSSEEMFLDAMLDADRFAELERIEAELISGRQKLETLLRKNSEEFNNERQKYEAFQSGIPSDDSSVRQAVLSGLPEPLNELEQAIESNLKTIREQIGSRREKLRRNAEIVDKQGELIRQRDLQLKECLRWRKLNQLIGSADGKKFQVFAQSLTFRIMLDHANRHLANMSDRYLLVRNDESEKTTLELSVLDAYQAGELRSTKNLSGGESFLVSLALALGLSSMSSRNVRVDSLFLDEGFGTLDDQTLDTALTVLEGLRQEGKQIGVISHVPAIRERIPLQIRVEPKKEGQSGIRIV